MKSLLNKSLLQYIACTIIILLICTPLFYFLTKCYYAEDFTEAIEKIQQGKRISHFDLEQDVIAGLMIQFGLIAFVLSISSVITMRFVSKRLWHPFNDTLCKTRTFKIEKGNVPQFNKTNVKEFNMLNNSLTGLMQSNAESYRSQKEFTENASHELQTPLAVIQSKLDLLMQENLTEQQMQMVQEMYAVNTRISRLNRNLLLLAKIDNNQYEQRERVDLRELLKHNKDVIGELYDFSNISCTFHIPCSVVANRSLLETMITNLMINAFRHSAAKDEIDIKCDAHCFEICNASLGKSLDQDKIFSRFNQSNDTNRGNGIGLSIVKAICDYHGWRIFYLFENNRHCFMVYFH